MKRKKPWQIRLHFFIHRDVTRHFLTTYNDMITVPLMDPSRGILARCSCGKRWAL